MVHEELHCWKKKITHPLFRIWHSQHLEDKWIFWKCVPLINGARGVSSSTLIFTLGFLFCCLQISHALKGFFHALRHYWCCTIIFAFTMLMHQVMRWAPHMIGSRQQASGVGQIESCNQSQSSVRFRCPVLHTYSILDPGTRVPVATGIS